MNLNLNRSMLTAIAQTNPGDFAIDRVRDGRLETLFRSAGFPAFSGMTEEEYGQLTGENASRIVLECDRGRVDAVLKTLLETGRGADFTYRILHKTRGSVWVHAKSRMMGLLDGMPVLMTVFLSTSGEAEEHGWRKGKLTFSEKFRTALCWRRKTCFFRNCRRAAAATG